MEMKRLLSAVRVLCREAVVQVNGSNELLERGHSPRELFRANRGSKATPVLPLVSLVAMTLLPTAAGAQILVQRCSNDSLNPSQAEARVNWARRCALSLHVGNPYYSFGTWIMSSNGQGELQEYAEYSSSNWAGENAYTGSSDNFEINSSSINKLYLSGATSQGFDDQGYYEWWRSPSRRKARPLYPVYGSHYDIASSYNMQLFPHPTLANCGLYLDKNGTQPATGMSFYLNGYCESLNPVNRCDADRLSPRQARERLEWVRRCALSQNVGSSSAWFDSGMPAANGGTLKDYSEANAPGDRRYTGSLYGYDINMSYIEMFYDNASTLQITDALGYYQWRRDASMQKRRPLYPIYGSSPSNSSGTQLFPNLSDCSLYAPGSQTPASSFYVTGYCTAIY
jgi:hypothetical protein